MPLPHRHRFRNYLDGGPADNQTPISTERLPMHAPMSQPTINDVNVRSLRLRDLCNATGLRLEHFLDNSGVNTEADNAELREYGGILMDVNQRLRDMRDRLRNERNSYLEGRASLSREMEEIERNAARVESVDELLISFFRRKQTTILTNAMRGLSHNRRQSQFGNHYVIGITILGLAVLAVSLAMGRVWSLESGFSLINAA